MVVFDHRVQDDQDLTHTSCECNFFRLSCCEKPLIEGTKDWVVADGDQGRHIQNGTDCGTPYPAVPLPSKLAVVPAEWGYTHQGDDLSAVERTEFREAGQQRECQGRADRLVHCAGGFPLAPQRALAQAVIEVPIEVMRLFFQDSEHSLDAPLDYGQRWLSALLLGDLHLDDLPPLSNVGLQFSSLYGGEGLSHSPTGLAEMGDGRSVEMVRFGQLPQGADEVSDLTGIDHSDRDTRRA